MWTVPQISEFLEARIGHVLMRPMMFGGSGAGVDLTLHQLLELWSMIHECHDEYRHVREKRSSIIKAGVNSYAGIYQQRHPNASEVDISDYVVQQYQKIIRQLKLPLPWKQIEEAQKGNAKSHVRKSR